MYIKNFFVIICFILILVSCSHSEEGIDIVEEHNPDNDQSFIIVNAIDLYASYLEEVIETGLTYEEKMDKYKSIVIEPVYDQCYKDPEYNIDFLTQNIPDENYEKELLNNVQEADKEKIYADILESLISSSNEIPTENNTTICIIPNSNPDFTTGYSQGSNKIILLYDENRKDSIKNTIAHEYHHSVWTEKYYKNNKELTLLDNMIFEGKAIMFEEMLYPEHMDIPIYPNFNLSMWEAIEDELFKTDEDRIFQVMQGYQPFPANYGYSEGYKMVGSFLEKHPDLTPEEWLGIEAQVVLEEGEYMSNYE